jgi:osmotically-inducible protein OsmY
MRSRILLATATAACLAVPVAAQTPAPAPQAGAPRTAQATDDTLKNRIDFRLETSAAVRKYDIRVKVENGVATLTGDVATAAQKAEAERLAKVEGVSRVNSEITVDPNEDKSVADRVKSGMSKTGEAITDAWITTKVKWFFMGEDALKDSNIDVDTSGSVVTLKGTVKSQAGRARANELARNTDGVKRVVDQLTIK